MNAEWLAIELVSMTMDKLYAAGDRSSDGAVDPLKSAFSSQTNVLLML